MPKVSKGSKLAVTRLEQFARGEGLVIVRNIGSRVKEEGVELGCDVRGMVEGGNGSEVEVLIGQPRRNAHD